MATAPSKVSFAKFNRVLRDLGMPVAKLDELAPIKAE